jgi:hypothetical protein
MRLASTQLPPLVHSSGKALQQRIELIVVALIVCLLIFELIRRRRLMERYAILWLTAGLTVLVLAVWTGLLSVLSRAAGISYLPSALFAVAFLFVLVMLVHFSMAISKLSDQNTILAQRLALLQERLDRGLDEDPDGPAPGSDGAELARSPGEPSRPPG